MEEIFVKNYQYQVLLKIFHFQTKSYAAHKASDSHLESVAGKFDNLLEVMQGKFGTIKFSKDTPSLKIQNFSNTDEMIRYTRDLNNYYYSVVDSLEQIDMSNAEIVNIIEEMIADNSHFIYLLKFE